MEKEMVDKISLMDVHAHLDELEDIFQALQEARASGIKGIIAVGVNVGSNQRILQIAEEDPGFVYPALGYHPWEIKEEEVKKSLSFIRDHIDECVALGEIGLDYKIKEKELQWKVFDELLNIAYKFDKPIIIHCRYSHLKAFEMVKEKSIRRAVFHWYSGPIDVLDKILAMGYFISATPALIYSPPHQEAIQRTPLERILLETDSPVSHQGKEAMPKDVWISMERVAKLKGLDLFLVSEQTTISASQFFQIPFKP